MSILSSVTSILELIKIPGIGVPRGESKPTRPDDHEDRDDYSKDGKGDYSKHDGDWKDAKNDDCQPHKDDLQPQKDYWAPKPSDDSGKDDTYRTRGEALS